MLKNREASMVFVIGACAIFLSPLTGQENRRALENQIPKPVANGTAREVGRYPESARMDVAIGLPLSDKEALKAFIAALYDPTSPDYKRYLTPDQFTERFGASAADYQKVADFLKSSGLTVTAITPNRMLVDVTGSVSDFERVFHFTMGTYQHPSESRQFHAPNVEPSVPLDIPILDVMGLDDYMPPRRMDTRIAPQAKVQSNLITGSGPYGSFQSKDLRAAYAPGVALDGSGQTVGIVQFGPYNPTDITTFEQAVGLPNVPIVNVLLDGVNGIWTPGYNDGEQAGDTEMAISMAPGLSQVLVYEGNNFGDVLNRMATDNAAKQLSTSWGVLPAPSTMDQIFMEFAAQGQAFFAASGDGGSYSSPSTFFSPGGDPYITLVGGTSLTTTGPGGAWLSETAWKYSGGGFDSSYTIPSWQNGISMTANMGSTTFRNYPDVAIVGDTVLFGVNNGQMVVGGGTSGSAPLWAGFLALANQQAAASQKPPVGFLNPTIYALGQGSRYNVDFHDITTGNNTNATNPNLYYAVPGYDLTTGWGTPTGQNMIDDLVGSGAGAPGFSLSLAPYAINVAVGASADTSVAVNPYGGFTSVVGLAVSGLPSGVTASFSPSSTASGSTLTLTVSAFVPAGAYIGTITGSSGLLNQTIAMTLMVATPITPDFTVSASPSILSATLGSTTQSVIEITPVGTFNNPVALSVTGVPQGIAASFSPASTASSSTLTLSVGSQVTPGIYTINIAATSGPLNHVSTVGLYVPASIPAPVPIDLSSTYNVTGIVPDNTPFGEGMGNCCAYPARLLGQSLVVQNVPFVFGPTIPAGTAAPWNAISGGGARITIQLPRGRFSSLQMLGTAFGAQIAQQFQLNYADGGSSTFTQSLSDWFSPQGFQGEGNALNMPYFLAENGVGYIPDVYLYSYGFNLDNCRIVASLTLPANAGVEILALTLVPTVTSSPTICGVQNAAASVNPTILTPGTFATIFGLHLAAQPAQAIGTPFPVTLGGVSVAVNGTPAPLYYVSPTQINFVVPWEVTGTQATIIVQGNGNSSNSMSVAIAPSAPYIFTVNQQGTGQADALIVGTTSLAAPVGAFPGSRPVQRGEYISLYATGLGAVQGPPQDGSASSGPSPTVQPVYVNISTSYPNPYYFVNQQITPQYSGLAPGFVGLYQVNIQIPESAASGDAVQLIMGSSNPAIAVNPVTIAIQ